MINQMIPAHTIKSPSARINPAPPASITSAAAITSDSNAISMTVKVIIFVPPSLFFIRELVDDANST